MMFALSHPDLFFKMSEKRVVKKYSASPLTEKEKADHLEKLISYMNENKPYLDPDLSLSILAEKIRIPTRYLSQIINESLHKNFFDFINSYRIEEAKARLSTENNSKRNILEVLLDCGFNSKSVFNLAFKKQTGLTPSQYKKRLVQTSEMSF